MRVIDAEELKRSIAVSALIEDQKTLEQIIDEQPTIEPKKGKWILTQDDDYEYCTCSECGYQNGENWMNGSDIPFCAMCGADMRGETWEH